MPSRTPIAYIDIRVFSHATEDIEKVMAAVRNILPAELAENVDFKKTRLKGHYNNPITLLKTRIRKNNAVRAVFEKLASGLTTLDKQQLRAGIEQHLEKGNLFIRLDKQSAYSNEIRLCSADPIRFRIRFRKSGEEAITEICREFGMLP